MERQMIKHHIEDYITELKRAVCHPLLERNVGEAKVDEVKAFFLLLPMLNGEKWTDHIHTAGVAVGAIHASFDAHDAIDMSGTPSRLQQLTILSGDYYSSIYYKLLASVSDFGLIRSLSEVIGQVHEVKTNFHNYSPTGPQQLLDAVRLIETGCIVEFLHTFEFSKYVPLVTAALPLLSLDSDSVSVVEKSGLTSLGWTIQDGDRSQVVKELGVEIQEAIKEADFIDPVLLEEIQDMTIRFLGKPI